MDRRQAWLQAAACAALAVGGCAVVHYVQKHMRKGKYDDQPRGKRRLRRSSRRFGHRDSSFERSAGGVASYHSVREQDAPEPAQQLAMAAEQTTGRHLTPEVAAHTCEKRDSILADYSG
ncbi:hypothetical protein ABBQ32_004268 [Trebouxia sp. C0010 RCD-2024]